MTSFATIHNTFLSNPKGVMDSVLSYGLQNVLNTNVRMYFYKFDVDDLVEILYRNDNLTVWYFDDSKKDAVDDIKDRTEYMKAYIQSIGLEGKRFLYDTKLRMAVNYSDFKPAKELDLSKNDFLISLDSKEGYVHGECAVRMYTNTLNSPAIDKSVIAFMNNAIGVTDPKKRDLGGCEASIVISGLLGGIKIEDVVNDLDRVDSSKFKGVIDHFKFNSDYTNEITSKLKISKFKRILEKKENLDGFKTSLRGLIEEGLDHYLKIVNPKSIIKIDIDCEWQTIRNAWIENGLLNIMPSPTIPKEIKYFKELFNSDNIILVMN